MAPDTTARPSRLGLSLYANLLDPSSNKDPAPGTISRAPVVFKQPAGDELQQDRVAAEKQQISAAALRFQPTKRPQLSAQKPKPKPSLQRAPAAAPSASPSESTAADPTTSTTRPPAKTTLADWTAEGEDNDVNGFYGGEKRQRGGRKKRKKNKEESHVPQNWDDIYDPSRPNNYEDYKHSNEKITEIREWKNKLYAHRMARRRDSDSDSSSDHRRPQMNKQFVPPGLSFAPPSFDDGDKPPQAPQPINVPNDPTGEDAYARRMRLSQKAFSRQAPDPHQDDRHRPLPLPPPPPPLTPPPPRDEPHPTQPPPPPQQTK
ncbi:hypothetical protein ABVK25_008240 [Lepraria finkii]|uniref:Uncharacterized protein n=1 Tax=Lepraria finkii TaxID=1340010 RepID=A0ABR4B707_9LECA